MNFPGSFSFNFLVNWVDSFTTRANPAAPEIEWVGTLGPDTPGLNPGVYDFKAFTTFSYFNGPVGASLRWRYLPSADSTASASAPTTTVAGTDSYSIVDLSATWQLSDRFTLRGGIDNVFDTEPNVFGRQQCDRDERRQLRHAAGLLRRARTPVLPRREGALLRKKSHSSEDGTAGSMPAVLFSAHAHDARSHARLERQEEGAERAARDRDLLTGVGGRRVQLLGLHPQLSVVELEAEHAARTARSRSRHARPSSRAPRIGIRFSGALATQTRPACRNPNPCG